MLLSRALIQLSYTLEDSDRYRRTKVFFYDLLENPRARIRTYFDVFMILLVVSTVWLLIYEVRNDLGLFDDVFEGVAVTIFILEYLLRFWIFNDSHQIILKHYERAEFINERFRVWPALREIFLKKIEYVTSPLAIIDLLAIIPSYRPLRFLRIFLLFRLFKLFRYTRSISEFVKVLSEKRIGDINFRERKLIPFGVVRKETLEQASPFYRYDLHGSNFYFNPNPNFVLQAGDFLVMFGHEFSVIHFRDCLERGSL